MNRGSLMLDRDSRENRLVASMRPRFMNRGSVLSNWNNARLDLMLQ